MARISDQTYSSPGVATPKQLFGYDVIDFIGEGAGSAIMAVSHPETGQLYALKHVVRKTEKDVRFIEQLENEHAVSQHFSHPGLRRSIDMKINRSLLRKPTEAMLLMELFDGVPMEAMTHRSVEDTVDIFIRAAGALDALHAHGYVHCDLKPNNILVGSNGEVKIIDFGQACPVGTVKQRIQGTPDYISPEQVKRQAVTVQTDVFNFGATMYWALAGRAMPTLFNIKKTENSFLFDELIASPAAANPQVPESLSNFVMECVKTNPAKRPTDMKEVVRRLEIIRHSMRRHAGQESATVA